MNVQKQFTNACENGKLEKAKEHLKTNPNINISANNELLLDMLVITGIYMLLSGYFK